MSTRKRRPREVASVPTGTRATTIVATLRQRHRAGINAVHHGQRLIARLLRRAGLEPDDHLARDDRRGAAFDSVGSALTTCASDMLPVASATTPTSASHVEKHRMLFRERTPLRPRPPDMVEAAGMTTFVSFLRGINVGGNKTIPMARLKALYESLGFAAVRTLLNSGNVVFVSEDKDRRKLTKRSRARSRRNSASARQSSSAPPPSCKDRRAEPVPRHGEERSKPPARDVLAASRQASAKRDSRRPIPDRKRSRSAARTSTSPIRTASANRS